MLFGSCKHELRSSAGGGELSMEETTGSLQVPADLLAQRMQAALPLTKGHRQAASW